MHARLDLPHFLMQKRFSSVTGLRRYYQPNINHVPLVEDIGKGNHMNQHFTGYFINNVAKIRAKGFPSLVFGSARFGSGT